MPTPPDVRVEHAHPSWSSPDGVTLMAVVNLNPDSFSDPRPATRADERLEAARRAVDDGAAIVDLGAQSAALAAEVVPTAEQIAVLVPLVEALTADGVAVSVDTYELDVAQAVLAAGAQLLNDFSGRPELPLVEATVAAGGWYVLTHNPVGPRRRQTDPHAYDDVVDDVIAWFTSTLAGFERAGVPRDRVVLDPGVDVGKTPAQTLALLRGRERLRAAFELSQLWAISRKDVVGALTGRRPRQRDPGTLALLAALADQPHTIARVHDVAGARDHLTVRAALAGRVELGDDLLADHLRREA